jgi:hypothetical protein
VLAGEAADQYVVVRDLGCDDLANVALGLFAEVLFLRDLGIFVPIRRKNTLASRSLVSQPDAADTAKQVDEL